MISQNDNKGEHSVQNAPVVTLRLTHKLQKLLDIDLANQLKPTDAGTIGE